MLGDVNRTVIAYLPHPENGVVSKLEIFNETELFRNAQKSLVSFVFNFFAELNIFE
jgi:hypothetical protein